MHRHNYKAKRIKIQILIAIAYLQLFGLIDP